MRSKRRAASVGWVLSVSVHWGLLIVLGSQRPSDPSPSAPGASGPPALVAVALLEEPVPAPASEITPEPAIATRAATLVSRKMHKVAVSFAPPSQLSTARQAPSETIIDETRDEEWASTSAFASSLPSSPSPSSPAPPPAPRPPPPAPVPHIGADTARALRVYDTFPKVLEQARLAHAEVVVQVCVSDHGLVDDAVIARGGTRAIDDTLRAAIRSWRYRPLLVNGAATPFCHFLRITYGMN